MNLDAIRGEEADHFANRRRDRQVNSGSMRDNPAE
jgi:hypothetical protein